VDGMLIAVGAKLFDFEPIGRISAVFAGGVTRYTRRSLVIVGSTFGTFEGNNQANAFLASHNLFFLALTCAQQKELEIHTFVDLCIKGYALASA
jgi:hypothetical protein